MSSDSDSSEGPSHYSNVQQKQYKNKKQPTGQKLAHIQQGNQGYTGNQNVYLHKKQSDMDKLKHKYKMMKYKISLLEHEVQQLRARLDDQGIQGHQKNSRCQNKDDQYITKTEYFQFKNWAKQIIENLRQEVQQKHHKHMAPAQIPVNSTGTINIGVNKIQSSTPNDAQKSHQTQVSQNIPPGFKTMEAGLQKQSQSQSSVLSSKTQANPSQVKQTVATPPPKYVNQPALAPQSQVAKKPATTVNIKQSLHDLIQERIKQSQGKIKEMYEDLDAYVQKTSESHLSKKYGIQSKQDAKTFVSSIKWSWFEGKDPMATSEAEVRATALASIGRPRWGIQIKMQQNMMLHLEHRTWDTLFNAMDDEAMFRCVLNTNYNFAAIRRISDGEVFTTKDLNEDWMLDMEDELLNTPCDVLIHDEDAHIGLSYLSVVHLVYYHKNGDISFNLNDPQELVSCYLENVYIDNIQECTGLISMTLSNSHDYSEVEDLESLQHFYKQQ